MNSNSPKPGCLCYFMFYSTLEFIEILLCYLFGLFLKAPKYFYLVLKAEIVAKINANNSRSGIRL